MDHATCSRIILSGFPMSGMSTHDQQKKSRSMKKVRLSLTSYGRNYCCSLLENDNDVFWLIKVVDSDCVVDNTVDDHGIKIPAKKYVKGL